MKIEEGKFYRTHGGDKVGPMSRSVADSWAAPRWYGSWNNDGKSNNHPHYDLVAEWTDEPEATGPIRTKTVTEIVPGDYGRIRVVGVEPNKRKAVIRLMSGNGFGIHEPSLDATELRAAATLFNQLADALEGGAS